MIRDLKWWVASALLLGSAPIETVGADTQKQPPAVASSGSTEAERPTLGLSVPAWRQLRYEASKLFISMTTQVELATGIEPPADLLSPGREALASRKPIERRVADHLLTLETRVLGRRSLESVYFRGADGQAVQRYKRRFGSKGYSKTQRFLERGGVFLRRLSPDKGQGSEEKDWTRRHDSRFDHPDPGSCPVIVDPVEIFYLLSAADLSKPGDRIETCVFSKKTYARLVAEVTAESRREVEFSIDGATAKERTIPTLTVMLKAIPLKPQDSESIEIIGLEGDLEIFVDKEHRLPVEICGKHSKMGSISIRLSDVSTRP